MAGAPKRRARREAERLRRAAETAQQNAAQTTGNKPPAAISPASSPLPALVKPQDRDVKSGEILRGEILPPEDDPKITRTAFKRAMRKRAAVFAEEAVDVLAKNLKHANPEVAAKAANDMLKWAGLDKVEAGELGGEGQQIVILRFGENAE